MLTRIKSPNTFLLLVILLAAFLRFYKITDVPPSLNWDEVSHGYNAYSVLKTGKDEWGETLPLLFRAYGDYKLPVYIYAIVLSEAIFGLNEFALRLPNALAGVGLVILTYLLTKRLFNKNVGLFAALLVSIEPWSFFLSRGAFEANLALFFFVWGLYLFLVSLEQGKYLILSLILFGLSVWTYNSYRIFTPLILISLVFIYHRELKDLWSKGKIKLFVSILIAVIFFGYMAYQLFTNAGQARYGWVAILDEGAIAQINEARGASSSSPQVARLIHNKATYFASRFAQNWIEHFSPDFLFFKGGSNYQFNVPGHGLLHVTDILFVLLGLYVLLKMQSKSKWLILVWLVLAPVASSLTREAPHVLRSITFLPTLLLISALGVVSTIRWVDKHTPGYIWRVPPLYIYLAFIFVSSFLYVDRYLHSYRENYSWSWQYGYKEVVAYAKDNYAKYDQIIVSKKYGEPHEFFLFYWPWDPESYRSDPNLLRFHQSSWYWVDRFDKFYFVNDWEIPKSGSTSWRMERGGEFAIKDKALLVTSPGNYPDEWRKLKTIEFLDGKPAFDILEKI